MLLRILMLGWLVCFYAFAVPTVDEIKATSGKQQIVLLNAYLKEQSSIDARQALALLIELKPNLPLSQFPEQRLELQLWEGVAQKYLGNKPEARSLFNTVINESQQSAFTAIKLQALRQRSFFHSEQTNYDLALSDALEVYNIVENSGDLPAIANAQNTLAGIYFATDQFSKAYEWFLKAEDNYRLAQDRHGEVIVWGRIGSMYRSLGDFDAALSYQLRTIEGLRQLDSDKGLSIAFNNTGIIYKDLGKYPQAIEMHLQSLELKQQIGYERGMVYSFNNLGETYRLMGDVETAKRYLREAELLANKLNNRMLLGSTYLYLGRIAITEQQYQDAENFLDTAMNTYRQRNSASRIAEGLVEQARLLRLQGQNPLAIEKLKEAIDFAQRAQKNVALFNAYELLAQTYADVGDYQSAFAMQQTYQASRDALFDSNSQQRIEMLVVQNQVADTKRNLERLRQQAELTESRFNNVIAKRNIIILAVVSSLIFLWYLYNRRMHKRELMLAEKSRVEIEEKEQQLSLALWASGDVLWNWDIKGQTVSRENASSLNALPEGKVEPSWQNMQAYVHTDDFPLLLKHLEAIQNAEEETFDVSYRVKDKAGEWAWVQDKGKVVEKDVSGNPLRVAGIQHDITILKQQEVDLISLNNELEQRVRQRTQDLLEALDSLKATQQSLVEAEKMAALGVLVAGLAHELNTPLGTAITAVTNLHAELKQLNDKVETGKLTKADLTSGFDALTKSGDLILSGVQRTSSLVEQFKRVSVSERGEGLVLQNFSDLAHTAFGEAWKAAGKPANVSLIDVPSMQITVYVDTLLQVLELLFSNAISHAQPADKLVIKVSLQEYDDHYEVIVEDNGVGISVEEQNKVFNPFYTLARHKGHVGLGLNIVFNLVSQVLGGVIECEQSELGGAKFRFTLNKSAEEITLQTV